MIARTRRFSLASRHALVVVLAAGLLVVTAGPAAAVPDRLGGRRPVYYLSLGDSLSRGVQPDAAGQNHPTDQGYADDLARVGRLVLPQLRLVKLGCETEETTTSMINGGRCTYPNGPAPNGAQLAEATAFLQAHRDATVLVTLDIGANDLSRCINRATGAIDLACVQTTFVQAPANLRTILEQLRAAAGPRVPIIGMNYYNPFLAAWLQGPAGQALARLSTDLLVRYNDALEGVYQAAGIPVANVQDAFSTTDFDTLVTLPGFGEVPVNVARVCQWTWMCVPPPMGPNVHGRPEGYWVMAGAFLLALVQAHDPGGNQLTSRSAALLAAGHPLRNQESPAR
jgi:GDSL-like Lipase/Acylhydrolase family